MGSASILAEVLDLLRSIHSGALKSLSAYLKESSDFSTIFGLSVIISPILTE